jgi:hypothetical protein
MLLRINFAFSGVKITKSGSSPQDQHWITTAESTSCHWTASMQHQAWQRVLVTLSDLKAFSHIEDEATRAAKMHLLQEAFQLDVVLGPVFKSQQAPTSFCESLVYRLKVRWAYDG